MANILVDKAIEKSKLRGASHMVLLMLCYLANDNNGILHEITQKRLMNDLRLSRSAITAAFRDCQDLGYLTVTKQGPYPAILKVVI